MSMGPPKVIKKPVKKVQMQPLTRALLSAPQVKSRLTRTWNSVFAQAKIAVNESKLPADKKTELNKEIDECKKQLETIKIQTQDGRLMTTKAFFIDEATKVVTTSVGGKGTRLTAAHLGLDQLDTNFTHLSKYLAAGFNAAAGDIIRFKDSSEDTKRSRKEIVDAMSLESDPGSFIRTRYVVGKDAKIPRGHVPLHAVPAKYSKDLIVLWNPSFRFELGEQIAKFGEVKISKK